MEKEFVKGKVLLKKNIYLSFKEKDSVKIKD